MFHTQIICLPLVSDLSLKMHRYFKRSFMLTLGLYLLSGRTSYRQFSRILEAVRLGVIVITSLWNWTSTTPPPSVLILGPKENKRNYAPNIFWQKIKVARNLQRILQSLNIFKQCKNRNFIISSKQYNLWLDAVKTLFPGRQYRIRKSRLIWRCPIKLDCYGVKRALATWGFPG